MSSTPNIQTQTPERTLIDACAAYWTRRSAKLTPTQARGHLRAFRAYGLDKLLVAIERWWSRNQDSEKPHWGGIGAVLKHELGTTARTPEQRRRDDVQYVRAWWASWEGKVRWATEILSVESRDADAVRPSDLEEWSRAWEIGSVYARRYIPRPGAFSSPADRDEKWREGWRQDRAFVGTYPQYDQSGEVCGHTSECVREHRLLEAHLRVRNLRTFGAETTNVRRDWLNMLEQDARIGGVALPVSTERTDLDETLRRGADAAPEPPRLTSAEQAIMGF